MLPNTVDIFCR